MSIDTPVHLDILPNVALVRLDVVMAICGLKRTTIYKMMALGEFPTQIKIGRQAVAWRVGQIRQWLENPELWRAQLISLED